MRKFKVNEGKGQAEAGENPKRVSDKKYQIKFVLNDRTDSNQDLLPYVHWSQRHHLRL